MQPYNYTIQTPDSGKMISNALTIAGQVAQRDQFLAQADKARQEQQAMIAKQEQEQIKRNDLMALAQNRNRTAKDVEDFMFKHGEFSKPWQDQFNSMSETEQRQSIAVMSMVREAISRNRPDLAVAQLDRDIEAAKNAGDTVTADKLDIVRNMVIADPNGADLTATMFLRANMDPVKYEEMMGKRGAEERAAELQPAKVKEANANAEKAAVAAKFAESDAVMDLQKKGWDIKKIQNDITVSRQNVAIAAQNAAIAKANSETARQEAQIKLGELVSKRDSAIREKAAEAESARANIDNFINTADRILQNPMLDRVLGSFEGRVNTVPLNDDAADAIALIETLGSQAFMAQIKMMVGLGSLSEAEGSKVASSLTNLSRVQSEKQFKANVEEAKRLMMKGRKNLSLKFGVPDTVPDTPAAKATQSGLTTDDILRELGVVK